MELTCALAGPSLDRFFIEFCRHPDGAALLRDKPDLTATLADRAMLAGLPEGSLGRAYLDFTAQYRFDSQAFGEVHRLPEMGRRLDWDDDVAWIMARGLQLHDVWHTLGGYGPDWAGEGGNIALTHGQIPNPGTALLLGIFRALPGGVERSRWRRFLHEARDRGRSAALLTVVPYEELLDQPIAAVRDELGLGAPEEAHPGGVPYSTFRYGLGKVATEAYEPLRETVGAG